MGKIFSTCKQTSYTQKPSILHFLQWPDEPRRSEIHVTHSILFVVSCREFCKRMDSDLPFYYWTLNERYRSFDGELPSFDHSEESTDENMRKNPKRLHRLILNRREDSSIFLPGRSFLPSRNKTSIRQRMHKPEALLPPVPR